MPRPPGPRLPRRPKAHRPALLQRRPGTEIPPGLAPAHGDVIVIRRSDISLTEASHILARVSPPTAQGLGRTPLAVEAGAAAAPVPPGWRLLMNSQIDLRGA